MTKRDDVGGPAAQGVRDLPTPAEAKKKLAPVPVKPDDVTHVHVTTISPKPEPPIDVHVKVVPPKPEPPIDVHVTTTPPKD